MDSHIATAIHEHGERYSLAMLASNLDKLQEFIGIVTAEQDRLRALLQEIIDSPNNLSVDLLYRVREALAKSPGEV